MSAVMEFKVAGDVLLMDIHVECPLAIVGEGERDIEGEAP
jgi:hypothetical protein